MSFDNQTLNTTFVSTSWLLELSLWPVRIVCPLLILLCPIANCLCITIFQSPIYNRSTSKWYFISIATFDTIYVLVTAPLILLITFQIYILNYYTIFCKLIVFLNYLTCQISAGLLACLSIDRLLATTCIYLYRYNCTPNLSKYVCLCVILMLSIINSHYLFGYTIDSDGYCSTRRYKWYGNIYSRLNVVYLLSYSIIPFTIITICNIVIVISVCQTKANMKKKYLTKKPTSPIIQPHDRLLTNFLRTSDDKRDEPILMNNNNNQIFHFGQDKKETKQQIYTAFHENQISSKIIDSHYDLRSPSPSLSSPKNRLSENFLLDHGETISTAKPSPIDRERRSTSRLLSSSSNYSHKMCIQLQITISLLAISICFIFCTLPNCISTIMIQTYIENKQVREFWQAMNYLSIIPLLITHSVNFIFYYLSSHMFRNRFKEYYLNKRNRSKHFSLRSRLKS